MKKLRASVIGIDQGDPVIFSDFEDGGDMWTGSDSRERRLAVKFSEKYQHPPSVHVSISLWDVDHSANLRADLFAENISQTGFDLVFRTWGDTRIARARGSWMSIGELQTDEDWIL